LKILAMIPARGGSTRVKRKNIRTICGKPLIAWAIEACKKSELLDKFVVSTEDSEIAKVAKEYGAEVLDRPKELSGKYVSMIDVLQHTVESFPDYDAIMLLQPTSPVRINGIIDRCINLFNIYKPDSLSTGYECKLHAWTDSRYEALGPSQNKKGWFYADGTVEIHKREVILAGKSFGNKRVKVPVPEYYNQDIDTELDVIKAEAVMKYLGMDKNG